MKKIIIILLILMTCGCADYKELSSIKIVSSIFIEKDENYHMDVSYIDKKNDEKIITCKGRDLTSTFDDCNRKTNYNLFYTHLNSIFITDNIDIDILINYVLRNPRMNNNFYLVNTSKDIYENEDNIGKNVSGILEDENANTFFDIMTSYINKKHDIYIPIYDGSINNYLLYKGNKPSLILDKDNTKTLLMLNNTPLLSNMNKCGEDYFSYIINNTKTSISKKNDTVILDVDINASLSEVKCNIDTTKVNKIKYLEDEAKKNITGEIYYLIDTLRDNNIDIFGVSKNLRNTNFEVNVDIHLFKKGFLLR